MNETRIRLTVILQCVVHFAAILNGIKVSSQLCLRLIYCCAIDCRVFLVVFLRLFPINIFLGKNAHVFWHDFVPDFATI